MAPNHRADVARMAGGHQDEAEGSQKFPSAGGERLVQGRGQGHLN
jgi:hypothetical protein